MIVLNPESGEYNMTDIFSAITEAQRAINSSIKELQAKKLCHYTSPDGLLGIFEKNTPALYFSQYDSLNDAKERKDIFECLYSYCDRLVKEGRMSPKLYNDITSIQQSDLFGITRETKEELILDDGEKITVSTAFANEECYTYICSFSSNNDSLPMWRMYSKADHYEGFCIEFSPEVFLDNSGYRNGYTVELAKVIYDESKKMELMEKVLSPIMNLYDSATEQDQKNLLFIVKEMIKDFEFIFKNKSFSYEEEIRAILHIPKTANGYEGKISERKYRQCNGMIVPYVIYNLKPSSVRNITIAPTIKEEIAASNLKDYLVSKGLNHVKIIKSDIPIRSV